MSQDTNAQPVFIPMQYMVSQPGQTPMGYYAMPYAMPQMVPMPMEQMNHAPQMAYVPVQQTPARNVSVPELDEQTVVAEPEAEVAAPNTTALLGLSLLVCCLFNFILGLPAVLFAFKARAEHLRGDIRAARRSANIALFFILASLFIGAIGVAYIIYMMRQGMIH
eukprot:TRINITY_DN3478_c0_g1_i1.p1 TRINITY_DN3478_c0_g1~~TRINITY_DN3478_c0_g1_i1.p1  ORF type:complete len:174 (+),score=46.93 TRINITY_DN3478_c0_g1_i1:29-523(+)